MLSSTSAFHNNTRRHIILFVICMIVGSGINVSAADEKDGTTRLFRFVQMSDTQPIVDKEDHWQRVSDCIDVVNRLKPDFVLNAGDITWSGTEYEYKRMKELLSRIEAPLHVVPGNHDTMMLGENDAFSDSNSPEEIHRRKLKLYHKYFGPDQWSVEYGDFQFVGFDVTKSWPQLSLETKQWLKKTFTASSKPYKFVVVHFVTEQAYNWDVAFTKSTQTFNTDLDKIMNEVGAVGYMHGHNHFIQAYKDANTGRLIFSSGSAVFNEKYGVMYFDVYKDSMVCFWQPVKDGARPLGVFDLKEVASDGGKQIINTAPTVSKITPTEVMVKWQTLSPLETSLNFRKKGDKQWINQSVDIQLIRHEIQIGDLDPNTEYQFYIDADPHEYAQVRSKIMAFETPAE